MRTTTKEFKNKVQQYITDSLGGIWDEQTNTENENAPTPEKLQNVVAEFCSWWNPYEKRKTPSKAAAFKSFLQGLPGCLTVDFTYYEQRKRLQEWHEQTEAEAEKYTDAQVEAAFYWLIFREFETLCKQNKIDF